MALLISLSPGYDLQPWPHSGENGTECSCGSLHQDEVWVWQYTTVGLIIDAVWP